MFCRLQRSRWGERRGRSRRRRRFRLINGTLGRNHSDGNRVDVQDERGGANGVQEIVLDVGSDSDLLDGNRQMHLFQIDCYLNILCLHAQRGELLNGHGEPFPLREEEVDDPCKDMRKHKNEKHSQTREDVDPIPERQMDTRYSIEKNGNDTNEQQRKESHPSGLMNEESEAIVLISV